jgi:hypothetical protein
MRPAILSAVLALSAGLAAADQVDLAATADNTLYENATGSRSNGLGENFFAGKTNDGLIRRGVIRFDLSAIPAGSTITSVQLLLNMARTQAGPTPVTLHRVLAAWGEGTSDAGAQEGSGATSTAGDATWIHAVFPGKSWATAGGDFAATASATTQVADVGGYTWGSTPELVADAQAWLDGSAPNHGWLVEGAEASAQTA